eukprot:COSAG04_NODE_25863_length_302_cov_0.965517_2_plen_35_part_01
MRTSHWVLKGSRRQKQTCRDWKLTFLFEIRLLLRP